MSTRTNLIVAGLVAVLLAAFVDAQELGVMPRLVYLAGNLAILAGLLTRSSPRRIAIVVALLATSLWATRLGLSSLGHRLDGIRPGMTLEEVRRYMAGYREGSGMTNPYTGGEFVADGTLIFKDPAASPGDQTWGVVVIKNGRVTSAYLSPD
ncbi:hypothetical protein OJF2_77770 [Aquisphaera giovannonii]|uniref:Uncharacterized protein n=1 Tax=Aquisphaera giovannonii TaxID=406548 RepID=A0A5B9WGN7_9BACT|nr:hypothetical protein [Aquisphaera giovannonii]QEH39165.1 hypothetical protein OJF2_77770 [Aquisphaera giovannonii]